MSALHWLPDGWTVEDERYTRRISVYTLVVQPTASKHTLIAAVVMDGRTVYADAMMISAPVPYQTAVLQMMRAATLWAWAHHEQEMHALDAAAAEWEMVE